MSKVLVHIHSDLEFKKKVTLGLMRLLLLQKKWARSNSFSRSRRCSILNCKSAGEIVGQGTEIYMNIWKV